MEKWVLLRNYERLFVDYERFFRQFRELQLNWRLWKEDGGDLFEEKFVEIESIWKVSNLLTLLHFWQEAFCQFIKHLNFKIRRFWAYQFMRHVLCSENSDIQSSLEAHVPCWLFSAWEFFVHIFLIDPFIIWNFLLLQKELP